MDKKKDTPAEVETVTVTMSRPVAEAVQAACEMYLRLHMGQFNDLAEDLCMAKHYADMDLTKDLGYEVTHWMPLPEPPERGKDA